MAGSITSLGLGSGLELQNILDQLKDVEKAPIRAQESEKATLKKQLNAYNSVNAKLYSMKSHALSLSLESDFLKNKVSVSDEEILTARVDHGVSEAVTSLEVVQKARSNSWTSVGVASKSAVIFPAPATDIGSSDAAVTTQARTMTIKYGAQGQQEDINVSLDSGLSLDQIAEAINGSANNKDEEGTQLVTATVERNTDTNYYIRLSAANGGDRADSQISVTGFDYVKADATIAIGKASDTTQASYITIAPGTTYQEAADIINSSSGNHGAKAAIVDDGSDENPFKLVLTAKSTGEDNRIAIQNLPMTEVIGKGGESLNAVLKVDGITFERQSNDGINDVIAGATLSIKKTGEASVSIQNDTDQVKQHILDLVEGFNDLLAEIKGEAETSGTTDDDTDTDEEEENPLKDSYAVKQMISDLHTLIGTRVESQGAYSSLFDLGMEIGRDGSITMDETQLDQAIAADPDGIKSLFLGSEDAGVKGLGDIINDGITDMVSQSGSVTGQIDSVEKRIDRLDEDIEAATKRLDKRYTTLTKEFSRLDTYINKLNNEASFLTSMIDSFNKTNEK